MIEVCSNNTCESTFLNTIFILFVVLFKSQFHGFRSNIPYIPILSLFNRIPLYHLARSVLVTMFRSIVGRQVLIEAI